MTGAATGTALMRFGAIGVPFFESNPPFVVVAPLMFFLVYFKSVGSSNTATFFCPTMPPYVSRKNASDSLLFTVHPISDSSNVKTPIVPSVLHAKSEKPFGVQLKSTTDSSKHDLITHTGLDRFVLQIVSFVS